MIIGKIQMKNGLRQTALTSACGTLLTLLTSMNIQRAEQSSARESAKIAEVYQINDPVHQECQDPLDIVIDSAKDFIKAEANQNITIYDIPEGPEKMILKQKIIELEKERDAWKKSAEEKDDWKKLALSIICR